MIDQYPTAFIDPKPSFNLITKPGILVFQTIRSLTVLMMMSRNMQKKYYWISPGLSSITRIVSLINGLRQSSNNVF